MSVTLNAGDTYSLTTGVLTTRTQQRERIASNNRALLLTDLRNNDLDALYSAMCDDPSIMDGEAYAPVETRSPFCASERHGGGCTHTMVQDEDGYGVACLEYATRHGIRY